MKARKDVFRILVGKPEGMRPHGIHRHRWENNIKIDLQDFEFGGMECIEVVEDRDRRRALVNAVMNLRVT